MLSLSLIRTSESFTVSLDCRPRVWGNCYVQSPRSSTAPTMQLLVMDFAGQRLQGNSGTHSYLFLMRLGRPAHRRKRYRSWDILQVWVRSGNRPQWPMCNLLSPGGAEKQCWWQDWRMSSYVCIFGKTIGPFFVILKRFSWGRTVALLLKIKSEICYYNLLYLENCINCIAMHCWLLLSSECACMCVCAYVCVCVRVCQARGQDFPQYQKGVGGVTPEKFWKTYMRFWCILLHLLHKKLLISKYNFLMFLFEKS